MYSFGDDNPGPTAQELRRRMARGSAPQHKPAESSYILHLRKEPSQPASEAIFPISFKVWVGPWELDLGEQNLCICE